MVQSIHHSRLLILLRLYSGAEHGPVVAAVSVKVAATSSLGKQPTCIRIRAPGFQAQRIESSLLGPHITIFTNIEPVNAC
ncbi:hypothetical protein BJV77DRAFT_989933 [Russula vinacea]|nr:hypothetical protein BJV77DRAFT_989933 [Russula vinacea]